MPRGGLSSDPEKRKRQLDGLRRGSERALARLNEIAEGADGGDRPAKDDDREGNVEPVTYTKPGKGDVAKPRRRPAKSSSKPGGRSRRRATSTTDDKPPPEPHIPAELPGFIAGLKAPFQRRYG